jgi:proteasome accessory factor A
MWAVSHDPTLRATVERINGKTATALEMQMQMLEFASSYAASRGLACVEQPGSDGEGQVILREWKRVLEGLQANPSSVADSVDWVAKQDLISAFSARHGLKEGDVRAKALDLQYHDMRPEKCLATRLGLRTMVSPQDAEAAMTMPPTTTRAWFRGECLRKWPADVVAANWDSLVFDIGNEPLRRIPMMEPLRGTEAIVGDVLKRAASPRELLALLGSDASEDASYRDPGMY